MKKTNQKSMLIPIIIVFICIALAAVMLINRDEFSVRLVLSNDGYLIGKDDIYGNLFSDEENKDDVIPIAAEAAEIIYEKSGEYYLGEDKEFLSGCYPMAINEAAAAMFISGNAKLVTKDFEFVESYEGLYLSDGMTFNADMERAYREEFILTDTGNGIFISCIPVAVRGSLTDEGEIPVSAMIRFQENKISFYYYEDGVYKYKELNPVPNNATLYFGDTSINYLDFLERLGLYQKEVVRNKELKTTPEAKPVQVLTSAPSDGRIIASENEEMEDPDTVTLTVTRTVTPSVTKSVSQTPSQAPTFEPTPTEIPEEEEEEQKRPTKKPAQKPLTAAPAEIAEPAEEYETAEKPEITGLPRPTNTPKPTSTPKPTPTPIPGGGDVDETDIEDMEAAPTAAAAATAPPAESAGQPAPPAEAAPPDEAGVRPPVILEWAKPEVTFGDLTCSVYTLSYKDFEVRNGTYLWSPYVSFTVKDSDGKVVLVKSYNGTTPVNLAPLRPDSEYTISANMTYVDQWGYKRTETLIEQTARTLTLDQMQKLHLTWVNGERYPDKIKLDSVSFAEVMAAEEDEYIEAAAYLSVINMHVTDADDPTKTYEYKFSSSNLRKLRSGTPFVFYTGSTLPSSRDYEYSFSCKDRFNNEITFAEPNTGAQSTCKKIPKVKFSILANEILELETKMDILNEGDAKIRNVRFVMYDVDGNEVATTVKRYKNGSYVPNENDSSYNQDTDFDYKNTVHMIDDEEVVNGVQVKFCNLNDKSVYYLKVYADYDIADYDTEFWHEMEVIGDIKLTTIPLAYLGSAYYNIEIKDIEDKKATAVISLNHDKTDPRLVYLMSEQTFSLTNLTTNLKEGICLDYKIGQTGSTYLTDPEPITEPTDPDEPITNPDPSNPDPSNPDPWNPELPEFPDPSDGPAQPPTPEEEAIGNITEEMEDKNRTGEILLTGAEWEKFKTIGNEITIMFSELASNTEFHVGLEPRAQISDNLRIVSCSYNPDMFKTYRETARVLYDTYYASSNFISLFGVCISDPDLAIVEDEGYPINVYLYNESEQLIDKKTINKGQTIDEMRFSNLLNNHNYTIKFFAGAYNKGWYPITYEVNKELYCNDLLKTLVIRTGEMITGNIKLNEISENTDLIPEKVIITDKSSSIVLSGCYPASTCYKYLNRRFSATGIERAVYKITADLGEESYNAFETGVYPLNNWYTKYTLYKEDPMKNPSAKPISAGNELKVPGKGFERCYWTGRYWPLTEELTGEVTLYLLAEGIGDSTASGKGIYGFYGISLHKIRNAANSQYNASINATVTDSGGQLSQNKATGEVMKPAYYLRVYSRTDNTSYQWIQTRKHEWEAEDSSVPRDVETSCVMNMYDYTMGENNTIIDTMHYTSTPECVNSDFLLGVDGNKYYKVELWIKLQSYNIQIGSVSFTTEKAVRPIRNEADLFDVFMDKTGNYLVTEDITVTGSDVLNDYNNNIYFNGDLDFNGHKLISRTSSFVFRYIGESGVFHNAVLVRPDNWGTETDAARRDGYFLSYINYGRISDCFAIYSNGHYQNSMNDYYGTFAVYNYGGVIENFAIRLDNDIVGIRYAAACCFDNRGTIRNGYVYSNNDSKVRTCDNYEEICDYYINTLKSNDVDATGAFYTNKYDSSIVSRNRTLVENVFSLVDVKARSYKNASDTEHCEGITAINYGTVKNSFTVMDCFYPDKIRPNANPAVFNYSEYGNSSEVYYCSEYEYGKVKGANSIERELLYDTDWYSNLFNSTSISKSGQFDMSSVELGYYPKLNWPECMQYMQENIKLPELESGDNTKVDVLASTILSQGETSARGTVTMYNPNLYKIRTLKINNLSVRIIDQYSDGLHYYLDVIYENPLKFYSKYSITGFKYSLSTGSGDYEKDYEEEKYVPVYAEFYFPIRRYEEFVLIRDDLEQNYKLYDDINFLSRDPKEFTIANTLVGSDNATGAFKGKFDGNNYTISNIDVGNYGYLFGKVTGSISNLKVNNIHTPVVNEQKTNISTATFMGLVGRLRNEAKVTNVHLNNVNYENVTQYFGSIAAFAKFHVQIQDCSAQNVKITTDIATTDAAVSIGGLVGFDANRLEVKNSFVNNIDIEALEAADVLGIGGIVGSTVNASIYENVYVSNGLINTNYNNAGGIIGNISTDTTEKPFEQVFFLKNYYSDVKILTMMENAGGAIGYTIKPSGYDYVYGLAMGSIISKKAVEVLDNNGNIVKDAEGNALIEFNAGPCCGFFLQNNREFGKHQYVQEGFAIDRNKFVSEEGTETDDVKKAYIKVLNYEQLTNPETYGSENDLVRPMLAWGDSFYIDEDKLADGILPKLYYAGTHELLPGQPDVSIKEKKVEVTDIYIKDNQLDITIQYDKDVTVEKLILQGIEYDTSTNYSRKDIAGTDYNTTRFSGYWKTLESDKTDKYFIQDIIYIVGDDASLITQEENIPLNLPIQYVTIATVEQWNELMASEKYKDKYYNIMIIADLDFAGRQVETGACVNRLVGNKSLQGKEGITISNMVLAGGAYPKSFIKQATGAVSNITFKNIVLDKTVTERVPQYGLFGSVNGDITNLKFDNVRVSAHNAANMGMIGMAYGEIENIELKDIIVAGSTLYTCSDKGGLIGRLSCFGTVNNVKAKNIYVDGKGCYHGGIIGLQTGGIGISNIDVENVTVISRSANYVGGIIGYGYQRTVQEKAYNLNVKNAFIYGWSYIGGIAGGGYIEGGTTRDVSHDYYSAGNSYADANYRQTVDNAMIVAYESHAGGIAAFGEQKRCDVTNSYILAKSYYIGGINGRGAVRDCTVSNSVISSTTDTDEVTGKNRFWSDGGNEGYLKEWKDRLEQEKTSYSAAGDTKAAEFLTKTMNLVVVGNTKPEDAFITNSELFMGTTSSAKDDYSGYKKYTPVFYQYTATNFPLNMPNALTGYIGGIAGDSLSFWGNVVTDCRIGSYNAIGVGGIVGRSISCYNAGGYRYCGLASIDCDIYGGTMVGGILGDYRRMTMVGVYSNSRVTAKATKNKLRDGSIAGGIIGRMVLMDSSYMSETPNVSQAIFAGTVTADSYVAGIVGSIEQEFYKTTDRAWVMLGDVNITNELKSNTANYLFNTILPENAGKCPTALLYDKSELIINGVTGGENALNIFIANNSKSVKKVTWDQLTAADAKSLYTTLGFVDLNASKSNYRTAYWDYSYLKDGRIPILRKSVFNGYNVTTAVELLKNQVDAEEKARVRIPVKGSLSSGGLQNMGISDFVVQPEVYVSGINSVNIDFTGLDSETSYELLVGGESIATGIINKRTLTFNYDYMSDITLMLTKSGETRELAWYAGDLRKNVMLGSHDYYYLTSEGVKSGKTELRDSFIHLWQDKGLTASGRIYSFDSNQYINDALPNQIVDEALPIFTMNYEDYIIKTFGNYSLTMTGGEETERTGYLMYSNGNVLEAVSRSQAIITDSFVLSGNSEKEYFAVLSRDRSIDIMLDGQFTFPEDFENIEIAQMSTNYGSSLPYVVIRYLSGEALCFNFMTGEIIGGTGKIDVYRADHGLPGMIASRLTSPGFEISYSEAGMLEDLLVDSGWSSDTVGYRNQKAEDTVRKESENEIIDTSGNSLSAGSSLVDNPNASAGDGNETDTEGADKNANALNDSRLMNFGQISGEAVSGEESQNTDNVGDLPDLNNNEAADGDNTSDNSEDEVGTNYFGVIEDDENAAGTTIEGTGTIDEGTGTETGGTLETETEGDRTYGTGQETVSTEGITEIDGTGLSDEDRDRAVVKGDMYSDNTKEDDNRKGEIKQENENIDEAVKEGATDDNSSDIELPEEAADTIGDIEIIVKQGEGENTMDGGIIGQPEDVTGVSSGATKEQSGNDTGEETGGLNNGAQIQKSDSNIKKGNSISAGKVSDGELVKESMSGNTKKALSSDDIESNYKTKSAGSDTNDDKSDSKAGNNELNTPVYNTEEKDRIENLEEDNTKNPEKAEYQAGKSRVVEVISEELGEEKPKRNSKFVTVFDTELQQYILYDENEFLNMPEDKLVSVNKKLEDSGKMIDYRKAMDSKTDKKQKEIDLRGILLVLLSVLVAGGLTAILVIKKQKENIRDGETHEN